MPDDDLLPPAPPAPLAPEPDPHPASVRCQFCQSSLTARGEVLSLSKKAKQLRDFEDDLEDVRRELATAHAEIENQRQLAESWKAEHDKLQRELEGKRSRLAI
jgi:septal ring factor EnvC (AmiA/AmiB activator)